MHQGQSGSNANTPWCEDLHGALVQAGPGPSASEELNKRQLLQQYKSTMASQQVRLIRLRVHTTKAQ